MLHNHIIHKNQFWNGDAYVGFVTNVFLKRSNVLPNANMVLYTNHLLKCHYIDRIYDKNIYTQGYGKNVRIQGLHPIIPSRSIYISKHNRFAIYKYNFPPISLEKNNTFIFAGATDFTRIHVGIVAGNSMHYDEYNFVVQEYLLE